MCEPDEEVYGHILLEVRVQHDDGLDGSSAQEGDSSDRSIDRNVPRKP